MSSANNTTYEPVHKDEDAAHRKSEEAYEDLEFDPDTELMGNGRTKSYKEPNKSRTVSRILAVANLVLFFVLLVTWLSVLRTTNQFCPGGPNPPWCESPSEERTICENRFSDLWHYVKQPRYEKTEQPSTSPKDSNLHYCFNPNPHLKSIKHGMRLCVCLTIHHSESFELTTSQEYDNSISVSKEMAKKHNLPRTVEMPNDSNELLYGVSVFHQLHCLDVIRQALYPEHYFPHHSHSSLLQHKSRLNVSKPVFEID